MNTDRTFSRHIYMKQHESVENEVVEVFKAQGYTLMANGAAEVFQGRYIQHLRHNYDMVSIKDRVRPDFVLIPDGATPIAIEVKTTLTGTLEVMQLALAYFDYILTGVDCVYVGGATRGQDWRSDRRVKYFKVSDLESTNKLIVNWKVEQPNDRQKQIIKQLADTIVYRRYTPHSNTLSGSNDSFVWCRDMRPIRNTILNHKFVNWVVEGCNGSH